MSYFLICFLFILWGFVALALGLSKHQKQVFNRELAQSKTRNLMLLGYALVFFALVIAMYGLGLSVGMSYWFGGLTLAALCIAWLLSYQSNAFFKRVIQLSLVSSIVVGFMKII